MSGYRHPTYVYFAEACGKVKIGCSQRPLERIGQVAQWVPFPITLLATMKGGWRLERTLHGMFREDWSHGEWFNASPRLMALIDDIKAGRAVTIENSPEATERDRIITEKKVINIRLWKAEKVLPIPDGLREELHDVRWQGRAYPDELRSRALAYLTEAGFWPPKRKVA